jgi:hypothetical protein
LIHYKNEINVLYKKYVIITFFNYHVLVLITSNKPDLILFAVIAKGSNNTSIIEKKWILKNKAKYSIFCQGIGFFSAGIKIKFYNTSGEYAAPSNLINHNIM